MQTTIPGEPNKEMFASDYLEAAIALASYLES